MSLRQRGDAIFHLLQFDFPALVIAGEKQTIDNVPKNERFLQFSEKEFKRAGQDVNIVDGLEDGKVSLVDLKSNLLDVRQISGLPINSVRPEEISLLDFCDAFFDEQRYVAEVCGLKFAKSASEDRLVLHDTAPEQIVHCRTSHEEFSKLFADVHFVALKLLPKK